MLEAVKPLALLRAPAARAKPLEVLDHNGLGFVRQRKGDDAAGELTRRLYVEPRDAAKQRAAKARAGVPARKASCLNLFPLIWVLSASRRSLCLPQVKNLRAITVPVVSTTLSAAAVLMPTSTEQTRRTSTCLVK